jgi:hypothetical protein
MGFFDKITKSVKNITKNPLDLRSYGDLGLSTVTLGQVDTNGINGAGSFEDALYGKKTKTEADDIAKLVKAGQLQGMREFNSALNTPAEDIVRTQAEQSKKGILQSAEDARRNAQRLMAQRGLSGSSLGLAQNRSIDMQAGKDIATINANLPGQIREQKLMDAKERISQGGLGASNPIQWNTVTGRGGGLLDLAGKLAPIAGMVAGLPSFGKTGVDAAGGRTSMSRDYLSGNTGGY